MIAAIGVIIGISGVISGIVIGIVLGNTGTNANNELYKNELRDDGYCDYKSYEDKHTKPCLKWTEKGRKWILDNYDKWVKRCA